MVSWLQAIETSFGQCIKKNICWRILGFQGIGGRLQDQAWKLSGLHRLVGLEPGSKLSHCKKTGQMLSILLG